MCQKYVDYKKHFKYIVSKVACWAIATTSKRGSIMCPAVITILRLVGFWMQIASDDEQYENYN